MAQKQEYVVLDLIESAVRNSKAAPLNLGGIAGVGGGVGGPPGGFIGVLPQTRVAYDTTEAATLDTAASGTLLDNLNHIRYNINTLASGLLVVDDWDGSPTIDHVVELTFSGASVTQLSPGHALVAFSGGSGTDPNVPVLHYRFSTANGDSDPGAGYFKSAEAGGFPLATEFLVFNPIDADGHDQTWFWSALEGGKYASSLSFMGPDGIILFRTWDINEHLGHYHVDAFALTNVFGSYPADGAMCSIIFSLKALFASASDVTNGTNYTSTISPKALHDAGIFALTVAEADGSPSVGSVDKIIFSGASVTNLGSGDVLVTISGGGGGITASGIPLYYDILTSQIPAASDHYDLANTAIGTVLLFYNTTLQSTGTFTMDVDNQGLTTSFSPVAGDTLIAVYGLSTYVQASPLTVEEYDGSPSIVNVDKIIFSGATVTDMGNGDALVQIVPGTSSVSMNARLTLETGVPVSTTDQTAKTHLYLTPYKGNIVTVYNGSSWTDLLLSSDLDLNLSGLGRTQAYTNDPAAGSNITLNMANTAGFRVGDLVKVSSSAGSENATITAVTTNTSIVVDALALNHTTTSPLVTNGLPYDVFVYSNSGVLAAEALAWTDKITRATALTRQNGVLVKSGDATRRYIGTFCTTLTVGQCEFSTSKRLVWNHYNRVKRPLVKTEDTNSWSVADLTWNTFNGSVTNRVETVTGYQEDELVLEISCTVQPVTNKYALVAIAEDSITTPMNDHIGYLSIVNSASAFLPVWKKYYVNSVAGYHYYQAMQIVQTATATYFGKHNVDAAIRNAGIVGEWWG